MAAPGHRKMVFCAQSLGLVGREMKGLIKILRVSSTAREQNRTGQGTRKLPFFSLFPGQAARQVSWWWVQAYNRDGRLGSERRWR